MQSRATRQFWRLFSDLPPDIQRKVKRAYRLFQTNPAHPGVRPCVSTPAQSRSAAHATRWSLRFKKVEGEDDIYSARITLDYRALAGIRKGHVVWY